MPLHNARFLATMENDAVLAGASGIERNNIFQTFQIFGECAKFSGEPIKFLLERSPVLKEDRCHSCVPNRELHGKKRTRNPMVPPSCAPSMAYLRANTHEFAQRSYLIIGPVPHRYAVILSNLFLKDPDLCAEYTSSDHTGNTCSPSAPNRHLSPS